MVPNPITAALASIPSSKLSNCTHGGESPLRKLVVDYSKFQGVFEAVCSTSTPVQSVTSGAK